MVNLFSSGAPHFHFFPSSGLIVLAVWSANGDCNALTSKASSKVNLLNDDAYRRVIVSSFRQIEQGVH